MVVVVVMSIRLIFFVWFTGKLIRKLIRNVNTCNYSKETGLAIVTHCGPSSNPGGSKERFPSLLFLLNSYPFLETNFV